MFNTSNQTNPAILIALLTAIIAAAPAKAGENGFGGGKPGVKSLASIPLAAGAGANDVKVNTRTNLIYVTNFINYTVSVLDGQTDQIKATIPVGNPSLVVGPDENQSGFGLPYLLNGPAASAIDEKTNTIYTINNNGLLTEIDGHTNIVKGNYVIDTTPGVYGLFTQDIVFSNKTGKLYVANYTGQIDVIDAKTKKVLKTIADDNLNFLAIDQRTNRIYASQYWDGTVWVIDGDTDTVTATINNVGVAAIPDGCYEPNAPQCTNLYSGPDKMAVDEELHRLYVANTNDGGFVTVDTETNTVISKLTIGTNQYAPAVDPVNHAIYTISDNLDSLAIVDGITGKVVAKSIPLGAQPSPPGCLASATTPCTNYGSSPISIAINPLTQKIYVAEPGDTFDFPNVTSEIQVLKATGDE